MTANQQSERELQALAVGVHPPMITSVILAVLFLWPTSILIPIICLVGHNSRLSSAELSVFSLGVEHPVWRLGILAGLMTGAIWAQERLPKPATDARIVRVRIGNSCGWCTEGYNEIETSVEPGRIVITNRSDSDKKKYPDLTQEYQISKQDWRDLQRLIDAKVLATFSEPSTGCPGCGDEPVAWVELEFNNGTKKSVAYVDGADPSPIVELRQKIVAIEMKAAVRPQ